MADTFSDPYTLDILWANIYHDTIIGSKWLLDKAISPGGPIGAAVGYNFLYPMYRILDEMKPPHILETGLGQTTKLTGQYAAYYKADHHVVEHDPDWVKFFCHSFPKLSPQTRIYTTPLKIDEFEGQRYYAYQNFATIISHVNSTCEFILIDGPFGGMSQRSRRDLVPYIPQILSKDFVIMIDDCGRKGEENLLLEICDILKKNKIKYAINLYRSGSLTHAGVIASYSCRFFTTV